MTTEELFWLLVWIFPDTSLTCIIQMIIKFNLSLSLLNSLCTKQETT